MKTYDIEVYDFSEVSDEIKYNFCKSLIEHEGECEDSLSAIGVSLSDRCSECPLSSYRKEIRRSCTYEKAEKYARIYLEEHSLQDKDNII